MRQCRRCLCLHALWVITPNRHGDGLSEGFMQLLMEPCPRSMSFSFVWHRGCIHFYCFHLHVWKLLAQRDCIDKCSPDRLCMHYDYWHNQCEVEMEVKNGFIFWVPVYFKFSVILAVCLGILPVHRLVILGILQAYF